MSKDSEYCRMQAATIALVGGIAVLTGLLSLLNGPVALGGIHAVYFGVTAIALGIYRYPREKK